MGTTKIVLAGISVFDSVVRHASEQRAEKIHVFSLFLWVYSKSVACNLDVDTILHDYSNLSLL